MHKKYLIQCQTKLLRIHRKLVTKCFLGTGKEISKLQDKETEMKKAAAKGSKAEQKAKKKQVEEEINRLSANLKERLDMHCMVLRISIEKGTSLEIQSSGEVEDDGFVVLHSNGRDDELVYRPCMVNVTAFSK